MEIRCVENPSDRNKISLRESAIIEALEKALKKNDIPECYYSLYGYGESCVCLQKSKELWMVYEGERELMFNVVEYPTNCLTNACYDLIDRITDKNSGEAVRKDFSNNIPRSPRRSTKPLLPFVSTNY